MVANIAVLVKCPIPETTRGSTTTTRRTHCIQPNEDSPRRPHTEEGHHRHDQDQRSDPIDHPALRLRS